MDIYYNTFFDYLMLKYDNKNQVDSMIMGWRLDGTYEKRAKMVFHVGNESRLRPANPEFLKNKDNNLYAHNKNLYDRYQRMMNNSKILYHQTDYEIANLISKTGFKRVGNKGLAGSGIYFATSKEHTEHKAINKGVIFECEVYLGNIKTISKYGDESITFEKLKKEGYDSVCIPRDNGWEYVVYMDDQVKILRDRKSVV